MHSSANTYFEAEISQIGSGMNTCTLYKKIHNLAENGFRSRVTALPPSLNCSFCFFFFLCFDESIKPLRTFNSHPATHWKAPAPRALSMQAHKGESEIPFGGERSSEHADGFYPVHIIKLLKQKKQKKSAAPAWSQNVIALTAAILLSSLNLHMSHGVRRLWLSSTHKQPKNGCGFTSEEASRSLRLSDIIMSFKSRNKTTEALP